MVEVLDWGGKLVDRFHQIVGQHLLLDRVLSLVGEVILFDLFQPLFSQLHRGLQLFWGDPGAEAVRNLTHVGGYGGNLGTSLEETA